MGDDVQVVSCPNCSELLPAYARYCPLCGETWDPPEIIETRATQPLAMTHTNWHKDVDSASHRAFSATGSALLDAPAPDAAGSPSTPPSRPEPAPAASKAPPPALSYTTYERGEKRPRRYLRPSLFFFVSMLVLGAMVVGGLFGVVATLGRGIFVQSPPRHGELTLQVTPTSVALGAMITLRGSNFSPGGRIGLSRDGNIPIFDTDGQDALAVNAAGGFSDTIIADPHWRAGPHLVEAEDVTLHKTAAFTVQVTGQSASLRPAHLLLSTNTLDLGSGDQTTNSTRTVKLSNAGGGQITWQATSTQSWLLFSPRHGTLNEGQSAQIRIAGDRSNLKIGSYLAQVLFSSNAGQATLPIRLQVTPLEAGHEAVLQLTPAVLSFSANDGGTNPPAQVVTVSNPGVRPLQWSTSVHTSGTSGNWLSVSPSASTTLRGQSEAAVVSVNTASLLPGNYSGEITFTGQSTETVQDSPQNVYVSLTVFPQCTLSVSPGALSFSGVTTQAALDTETLNLGVSAGCTTPLSWNASTTASWLHISAASGQTPSTLTVTTGTTTLNPGTYTSTILFNSQAGTQSLPVTYIVGKPREPNIGTSPGALNFSGVIGQPAPAAQSMIINNSGGGTLNWKVVAATAVGGSWLSVTPTTGSLSAQQSASLKVAVNLPASIIPGTYNGTITVTGTDSSGQPVSGSSQVLNVTLTVKAPCSISASPAALTFAGVAGQAGPAAQVLTIAASGTCSNPLNWMAAVSGGTWLSATPASGTVSLSASTPTSVAVSLTNLTAGTYSATITINATDSVTHAAIKPPAKIGVTLTMQAACTLQASPVATQNFTVENGGNPAAQSFTVSTSGACSNTLALTPTVTLGSGSGWLAVNPANAATTTTTGSITTFTVVVASSALASGSYSGSISLSAVDEGVAVVGSPQIINVTLNVLDPPALSLNSTASPQPITFTTGAGTATNTGTTSQSITFSNTGDAPLNWTARLANNAPTFLTLSATSGTNLVGGAKATITVTANPTGAQSGTYTTTVIIRAIDPLTNHTAQGSPIKIPITIQLH